MLLALWIGSLGRTTGFAFRARESAFSVPRAVLEGYLAKLMREPSCEVPRGSPGRVLGAFEGHGCIPQAALAVLFKALLHVLGALRWKLCIAPTAVESARELLALLCAVPPPPPRRPCGLSSGRRVAMLLSDTKVTAPP